MKSKMSPKQMYTTALSSFTFTILITSVFRSLFAGGVLPVAFVWQIAIVSVATGLLQGLFFSTLVIKSAAIPVRVLGFLVCLLAVLCLLAWVGAWFPMDVLLYWVIFVGSFFAVGIAVAAVIAIYYARVGQEYTKKLRDYQNTH